MKNCVCGVDLGGTKIGIGIVDSDGKIIAKVKVPTPVKEGKQAVLNSIVKGIEDVITKANLKTSDLLGIGVGSPGPLSSKLGIIYNPNNLPGFENVEMVKFLNEKFGTNVKLQNDANAAALGEYIFGTGKGTENFVYVTVSTGIGGGLIINGKIFEGANSNAVEIGHMTILDDGPACSCGNIGCYEALASGTALQRFAREAVLKGEETLIKEIAGDRDIKAEDVFKAYHRGDKLAAKLVEQEAYYLGVGMINIIALYNPERIAIGGGVSNEFDVFYDKMMETIEKRALKPSLKVCDIVKAKVDDVGIVGAASLIYEK